MLLWASYMYIQLIFHSFQQYILYLYTLFINTHQNFSSQEKIWLHKIRQDEFLSLKFIKLLTYEPETEISFH